MSKDETILVVLSYNGHEPIKVAYVTIDELNLMNEMENKYGSCYYAMSKNKSFEKIMDKILKRAFYPKASQLPPTFVVYQ